MSSPFLRLKPATKKLFLLPSYLVIKLGQPFFRADHPWKDKDITLEWWARGATQFTYNFCAAMWIGSLTEVFAIWSLLHRTLHWI